MDFWGRSAKKLPTNKLARESINYLDSRIADSTGDLRAFSHVQLYKIYFTLAKEEPLLSSAFRHLARYHLEESLVWMEILPEPLAILGPLQMKKRNLLGGIETISKFLKKQRTWMQEPRNLNDSERLKLCEQLTLGASARSQLGQFALALEWFTEAFEEFKQIAAKVRNEESTIGDSIILGISNCLLLEFRYAEAQKFIDEILIDENLTAYEPALRRLLVASSKLMVGLLAVTHNFQPVPNAEELWSSLMQEVQQCDSPEVAREIREKIFSAIKTHDGNRQIRYLAAGIEKVIEQQQIMLKNVLPTTEIPNAPQAKTIDLSALKDLELRDQLASIMQASDTMSKDRQLMHQKTRDITHMLVETTQRLTEHNLTKIHNLVDEVYRIPPSRMAGLEHRSLYCSNPCRFILPR